MKHVAVLDLKAFYASVECIERKLDPFTTPLVVCDTSRGMGTIVLSCSPYLKKLGVPSRCRRRDIPHIPNMIYATPRMALYVSKSCEIMNIVLDFVSEEDLHIYSIDEFFINLDPYLKLYNMQPEELVRTIQKTIKDKTSLVATAGISYNPFMAKVALDNEGKNKEPDFLVTWNKDDVKNKLWKITPLSNVWGIAKGYEKRLNALGLITIEDVAKAPIDILRYNFGIMGEQFHDLANGIDDSDIQKKYVSQSLSFSTGQALFRDFNYKEARTLLREMSDNLCERLHKYNYVGSVTSLAVMYSANYKESSGFSKQSKLVQPSDNNDTIYESIMKMYDSEIKNAPIRRLYIGIAGLNYRNYVQLNLFEDSKIAESDRLAQVTIEKVQDKYGKDKLSRATALLDESTYIERSHQIGGHKK